MRITVLTQYYKPEMGAPQNRLLEMCTGLKKCGADVSVITGIPNYPTGNKFKEYRGHFRMKEELDGIEVIRYWLYASNSRKPIPRIISMLSFSFTTLFALAYMLKRNNDFIIVESPPLTLGLTAFILSRLTGAKLIMNVSDLWPLSAKEMEIISGDGFIYKMLECLEHFLYAKSDFCMGQSQEIVDYMKEHGAKDVYLFRNGVDPKRFGDIAVKSECGSPLKIVYAGLLGYAQGVIYICHAINFKKLNAEFHIYGAGGGQQDIEDFLKEHPDNGVYYHGIVTREEIPLILSSADCTLIPLRQSIFGAVPSKIYESMAAGLPILFSSGGEGERIVKEYQLGLTSPAQDYGALEQNIQMLAASPNLYATFRSNCIHCAKTIFNRPAQVKALYDFLETKKASQVSLAKK